MKVLIWQWGRRGAGPLVAEALARELGRVPGVEPCLSLSTGAELLGLPGAPENALPVRTYRDRLGFLGRAVAAPWLVPRLARRIRAAGIDVAVCAMPAPYDLAMAAALRRSAVPYAVVVHDAELHPGDAFPLQMPLQRLLLRRAGTLFALSTHVMEQLRARGLPAGQPLLLASHPPFRLGEGAPPVGVHGGPLRLLSFGRLLPYKGLDLLADAVTRLPPGFAFELRVVGSGPEGPELARLRALPSVTVENRWVPETEVGALLGWADALVLTHREASQSGVAAAAVASRRWMVATRVGGLLEQLEGEPMAVMCAPDADAIAAAILSLGGRNVPAERAAAEWWGATSMVDGLRALVRPEQAAAVRGARANRMA